jgi:hypothetical protein
MAPAALGSCHLTSASANVINAQPATGCIAILVTQPACDAAAGFFAVCYDAAYAYAFSPSTVVKLELLLLLELNSNNIL